MEGDTREKSTENWVEVDDMEENVEAEEGFERTQGLEFEGIEPEGSKEEEREEKKKEEGVAEGEKKDEEVSDKQEGEAEQNEQEKAEEEPEVVILKENVVENQRGTRWKVRRANRVTDLLGALDSQEGSEGQEETDDEIPPEETTQEIEDRDAVDRHAARTLIRNKRLEQLQAQPA